MQPVNFDEALEGILTRDRRYDREAYSFIREGIDFTQKLVGKAEKGALRHVTGRELLEGLRQHALDRFGPMGITVLNEWGITRCEDFGEIVFNMIEARLLAKEEKDTREDFKSVYTFEEAFIHPFLPQSRLPKAKPGANPAPA